MELGSLPGIKTFVPMPRMLTCASPAKCETVSDGTNPARPSTVCTPSCWSVLSGSAVTAMGVVWISAVPVFVAVTVTFSRIVESDSTKSSVARPLSMSTSLAFG